MKQISWAFLLAMLLIAACCNQDDPTPTPTPDNVIVGPDTTVVNPISPDSLKEELLQTGLDFIGKIEANDHKYLVDLGDYLIDKYEKYNDDDFATYSDDVIGTVYTENRTTRALSAMRSMMSYVFDAIGNNGGTSVNKVVNVYDCIFDFEFEDICARFYPNEDSLKWVLDTAVKDRIEVLLHDKNGKDVVLVLRAGSATTTVKGKSYSSGYSKEKTMDVVAKIPQELIFTITQDGKELVRCNVNSSLNSEFDAKDEDYFKITVQFSQLSISVNLTFDGYELNASTEVTPSTITVASSMKINSEEMYKMSMVVNGTFNNKTFSENDDEDDVINLLDDAAFGCSILDDRLKVNAKVPDAYDCYEACKAIDEADDRVGANEYPEVVADANKTFTASFSYEGSKQADLLLETFEVESYYRENYYQIQPVLQFTSDNSKIRVDRYFTEKAFKKLIDACEALEHDFEELFD